MGKLIKLPPKDWPRVAGWLAPGDNCTQQEYAIILRAFSDIGIMEVPLGTNRGTRIDAYARRAGLPVPAKKDGSGWWWCAIWVGCVWADCRAMVPQSFPACDEWIEHLSKEPRVGSAILYGLRKVRSDGSSFVDAVHIGIVARLEPLVLTIEGNRGYAGTTNNGVAVDIGPPQRKDILGYIHPTFY